MCIQIVRVEQTHAREVAFVSDYPITTKGVQFEVPKDTQMLFGAPVLNFEKGKVRDGSQAAPVDQVHPYSISPAAACLVRVWD